MSGFWAKAGRARRIVTSRKRIGGTVSQSEPPGAEKDRSDGDRQADAGVVPEGDGYLFAGLFDDDQVGDGTEEGEVAGEGGGHGEGEPAGGGVGQALDDGLHDHDGGDVGDEI